MNTTRPNTTEPIPRSLTPQELAQASGGGSTEYLFDRLTGVTGETSDSDADRPAAGEFPYQVGTRR